MSAVMSPALRQHSGPGMRHLEVVLLFLIVFLEIGIRLCTLAGVPLLLVQQHNVSTIILSLTCLTILYWTNMLIQLPIGFFAGSNDMLIAIMTLGAFLTMTMIILLKYLYTVPAYIIYLVTGIMQAVVPIGVHSLLGEWVPPSERARSGAFIYGGESLGKIAIILSAQAIASQFVYSLIIYYVLTVMIFAWYIIYHYLGSATPSTHRYISQSEREYIEESLKTGNYEIPNQTPRPLKRLLLLPSVWAIIVAHCCQIWLQYFLAIVMFNQVRSGTNHTLTWEPYLAMWLVTLFMGWLSDCAVRNGLSVATMRKICNTVGSCGPAVALVWQLKNFGASNSLTNIIVIVAMGLNGASVCGFYINHIDLSPKYAGFLMSVSTFFTSVINLALFHNLIVLSARWNTIVYATIGSLILSNVIFIIYGKADVQH